MISENVSRYENVVVRNHKEIGINNYGLDYLVKIEQELERYKNIIDEVLESVCCIEHNLDKYEEIGLDHLEYAQNKIAELKEYLIEVKGE